MKYRITVVGLEKDGHPVETHAQDGATAARLARFFRAANPDHAVEVHETLERLILRLESAK